MIFWGTRLGSVREQAVIAWDYDGDMAIFLKPGVTFDSLSRRAVLALTKFGYRCTQRNSWKYRVPPQKPMCWAPHKELYQEVLARGQSLNRAQIAKRASAPWNSGTQAARPHGSNSIDVEVCTVSTDSLTIRGARPLNVKASGVFSNSHGVLGLCLSRCRVLLISSS